MLSFENKLVSVCHSHTYREDREAVVVWEWAVCKCRVCHWYTAHAYTRAHDRHHFPHSILSLLQTYPKTRIDYTHKNCSRCIWEKAPSGIVVNATFTIVLRWKKLLWVPLNISYGSTLKPIWMLLYMSLLTYMAREHEWLLVKSR